MEVKFGLTRKTSHQVNELKDKKKSTSINESLKLKCKYYLIIRLKTIKYK